MFANGSWKLILIGVDVGPGVGVLSAGHGLAAEVGPGAAPGPIAVFTQSVPLKQSKKLSNVRFSCTITTICWILPLPDVVVSMGASPGDPLLAPNGICEQPAMAIAIASTHAGTSMCFGITPYSLSTGVRSGRRRMKNCAS